MHDAVAHPADGCPRDIGMRRAERVGQLRAVFRHLHDAEHDGIDEEIVFRHLFLRHPLRMVDDKFQIRSDLLQKIAVILDVIHRSLSRPVKFL